MATTIILDGKRVEGTFFGHNPKQGRNTKAVPQPHQPSSSKKAFVPKESGKKKESEDVIVMPKRHRLFDAAFEESLGYVGRFTCPYDECHFSNYIFGFRTKGARNRHMAECSYGKGKLQKNMVATDGQMPSARFIENLIDRFTSRVDLNRALEHLFKRPEGIKTASSLIISAPPAAQESLNKNSQTAEQSRHQLPKDHPTENATLGNNNVILNSHGGSGQVRELEMSTSGNNVTSSSYVGTGQLQENYPQNSGELGNDQMMGSNAEPALLPEHNLIVGGSFENLNSYGVSGQISENDQIQSGVLGNNNVMVNSFKRLGQFPTLQNNVILSSSGESRTFPVNYQPECGAFSNDGKINSFWDSGLMSKHHFPTDSGNIGMLNSYAQPGLLPEYQLFKYHFPTDSGNIGMFNSYAQPGLLPEYHFPAEMSMLQKHAILSSYGTSGQFPQQYPTNSDTNVTMNPYGELAQLPEQYVPQSGTLENNGIMNSFGETGQFNEYYAAESGIFGGNGMVCSYDELREILGEPHPTQNALGVSNLGQIPRLNLTQGANVANNEIGSSYRGFGQLTGHHCAVENQTSAVGTDNLGSFNENFHNASQNNSHGRVEATSTGHGFPFSEIDKMFDSNFHEYVRGTKEYENVSMEDFLISNPSRLLDDPFAWNS